METMKASRLVMAGKSGRKTVNHREYRVLVGKTVPRVIRDESENEHYTRLLESLDSKPDPTPAEKELAELLTALIENFEEQHYALKRATPIESLTELMRASGLKRSEERRVGKECRSERRR